MGASLFCDPERWMPEAARLLRPSGRLVFLTTSVLAALCLPERGAAVENLVRRQCDVYRLESRGHGVEFHPGHGDWIRILRASGFAIDALHELRAPQAATTHPYYELAAADWARRWPAEDLWAAHLMAA
jgi:hypothetical protein